MNATWSALTAGCVSIFVSVTSGPVAVRAIGASARTIAVTTSDTYRFMIGPLLNNDREKRGELSMRRLRRANGAVSNHVDRRVHGSVDCTAQFQSPREIIEAGT